MSWQLLPAAAGNRPPRFVCAAPRAATHRRSPSSIPARPGCRSPAQPEPRTRHQAAKGNKYNVGRPWPGGGFESQTRWQLPLSVGDLGCAVKSFSRWQGFCGLDLTLVGGSGGLTANLNAVWKGKSMYRIHTGKAVCQWPLPGD